MKSFGELISDIKADLFRYNRQTGFIGLLRCSYDNPGFKFSFWFRVCSYLFENPRLKLPFYYLVKIVYNHYKYEFGIDIPIGLCIGEGLYIGHFGGIVIGAGVKIGKNCNISHGVTLGRVNRGPRRGNPVIGDNVYIGVGAKVIGNVLIGNNVAIGANCVVVADAPDSSVVAGVPGKIISNKNGSRGYVNNTDY